MLALETKKISGGKLLHYSDLRGGGGVSKGSIGQQAKRDVGDAFGGGNEPSGSVK